VDRLFISNAASQGVLREATPPQLTKGGFPPSVRNSKQIADCNTSPESESESESVIITETEVEGGSKEAPAPEGAAPSRPDDWH
jgi:hypothetical protein